MDTKRSVIYLSVLILMSFRSTLRRVSFLKGGYDFFKSLLIVAQDTYRLPLIKRRLRKKMAAGKKINLIFYIESGAYWNSFSEVYHAACADERFNVLVIAAPRLSSQYMCGAKNWRESIRDNSSVDFCVKNGLNYVPAFNQETGELLDLITLEPDIIFPQKPYSYHNPPGFSSSSMRKNAIMCYLNYAVQMSKYSLHICYGFQNLKFYDYIFAESDVHIPLFELGKKKLHRFGSTKIVSLGCPKIDLALKHLRKLSGIADSGKQVILYAPRWTTVAGECSFEEYSPYFLDELALNKDVHYIFRPHPLMKDFFTRKIWKNGEWNQMMQKIETSPNCSFDDNGDYYKSFEQSTVLVADLTSFVVEYLFLDKPIIYTTGSTWVPLVEWAELIMSACYKAETRAELDATLVMLRNGDDPLREVRKSVREKAFVIDEQGASKNILNYLLTKTIK